MIEYLRDLQQTMLYEYQASRVIKHKGKRGSIRQEILVRHLEKILPDRFGIASGEIRASNGATSADHDVVIYDKPNCPMLYDEKGHQILPIESVFAVIEVKSKLQARHLRKLSEQAIELRNFDKFPRAAPIKDAQAFFGGSQKVTAPLVPGAFMFAFEGQSLDSLENALQGYYRDLAPQGNFPVDPWINAICALDKGVITLANLTRNRVTGGPIPNIHPFCEDTPNKWLANIKTGDDAFAIWFLCLFYFLVEARVLPPSLLRYVKVPGKQVALARLPTTNPNVVPDHYE